MLMTYGVMLMSCWLSTYDSIAQSGEKGLPEEMKNRERMAGVVGKFADPEKAV